jgi:hypothetical protein
MGPRTKSFTEEENLQKSASNTEGSANEKLWMAVIDSAIEDWVRGPGAHKRKAEFFLFQDEDDFPYVCRSAGLDPSLVRESLWAIRAQASFDLNANVA